MTVEWNDRALIEKVRRGANRGVFIAAEHVRTTAIKSILQGSKTGRIYRRRSRFHRASAPGEAPASDTGRLVNSGVVFRDQQNLAATVNFSTAYAAALEFGTERIEPRPFLLPALDSSRDQIENIIFKEIRMELR